MKLIKLEVENFKRLKALTLDAAGKPVVIIAGDNDQGKSSALDAIAALFGGKKACPKDPVRHGAKKATIIGTTETLIAERRFDAKTGKTEVTVRGKDGAVFASPQDVLDKLYSPLTFDPEAFLRMDTKEQAAILRKLAGLDFTSEDTKRQEAYDKRTEVGREIKRLQGALEKMPESPAGTPDVEVSVAELTKEIERRQSVNVANADERRKLDSMRSRAAGLLEEIEQLERTVATKKSALEELKVDGKAQAAKAEKLADADLGEVRAKIANAEKVNADVRAKHARAKLEAELAPAIDESERLTVYVDQVDELKRDAIAKAKYPIEGLTVENDAPVYKGTLLEQAGNAARIRIATAIGFALHPELKVLVIKNGSLFDEKSLAAMCEAAAEVDGQLIIECVGDRKDACVVIEDGLVKGAETKDKAA